MKSDINPEGNQSESDAIYFIRKVCENVARDNSRGRGAGADLFKQRSLPSFALRWPGRPAGQGRSPRVPSAAQPGCTCESVRRHIRAGVFTEKES